MRTANSRAYLCLTIFLFALSLPASLLAGNSGKITGIVKDSKTSEPIPGVNVSVEGLKLGASSDVDGHYVILNVPPGVYTVTGSFIGYKKFRATDIRVSVDFTTILDVTMEEGSVELEGIVVHGERTPLIRQDLTNPVASISSDAIEALPVTEISDVIGLQAGVTVGDDGALHIRGGLGNEILYTVNGVNVDNPFGNTRALGLATNAVQEVSVSSGTFNAEYGSALSGVVNYVTKEGSSRWTGSFKYYTGDYATTDHNLYYNLNIFKPANVYRYEGSVGGPIVSDRLSFFASGVYNWNGGYLYGQQVYRPEDGFLYRNLFPSGDPRLGASTDPYYFAPALHNSGDRVGLPTGNGKPVAMNWSKAYSLQGNVSYRPTPATKFKYEFIYNLDESPSNSGYSYWYYNEFKPDGRAIDRSQGYLHAIEFTHSVSDRVFYTVKGAYTINRNTTWAFDNPTDPRYIPSFYLTSFTNTGFYAGGVDPDRYYQRTDTYAGKFDIVAELFSNHEVKGGIEVRKHKLEYEAYELQFVDPSHPDITPSFPNLLQGYSFVPMVPSLVGGYTHYLRRPLQVAAYLQDKIELFRSIILNLGLRYEYFRPDAPYNADLSYELTQHQETTFLQQNLVRTPDKHMLAPRFSVSYPITDQGSIRFSYGHFYQIGSLSSLYQNPNFLAQSGANPAFGNPNVSPQKSIQYELGLQQGLTEDMKIDITAYYKDVDNYIYNETVITGRGDRQYSLLTNLSYANARGVTVSLVKRRAPDGLFSATLDYTFQVAEGNRTQPTAEIYYNENRGQLTETYLVPLGFDRSHTITGTVSLAQPNDWSVSMIGWLRAGTPYTPAFPANVVPIAFVQNSDRQPMQWDVDIKAEKFFRVSSVDFSLFLQVENLFDVQNQLSVYANSGNALYSIQETLQPELLADLQNRIARGDPGMPPQRAVTNYYANPSNVGAPRLVRFGASILL